MVLVLILMLSDSIWEKWGRNLNSGRIWYGSSHHSDVFFSAQVHLYNIQTLWGVQDHDFPFNLPQDKDAGCNF